MVERVCSLARQLGVGEAFPGDLRHQEREAVGIIQWVVFRRSVVIAEYPFVKVVVKMERFNSNIGPAQCPLQETPKVIQALRVYLAVHVLDGMIHNFMSESLAQLVVADSRIGVDLAAVLDVVQNLVLQGLALHVRNDLCAHLSQTPVKHSKHCGLTEVDIPAHFLTSTLAQIVLPAPVHLVWIRADKGLVTFYWAAIFPAKLDDGIVLHSFTNPVQHEPCAFLRNSNGAVKLPRADAILAVA